MSRRIMSDTKNRHRQQPQEPSTEERRRAQKKILRAQPVEGEIDYARLSREHIARYPKIRARLAE
jgi:hypothetical protein